MRALDAAQAVVLCHVGQDDVTVGGLAYRDRYLSSNLSYNVCTMIEADYLIRERSTYDKQSTRLHLSEKGLQVRGKLQEVFNRQATAMGPDSLSKDDLRTANEFWPRLNGFGVAARASAVGRKASAAAGYSSVF